MRKVVVLVCVLTVISMTSVFAFGIGIQGGFNAGIGNGDAAVTFKLDNVPFVFAGNVQINGGGFGLGLTADYWVLNDTFIAAPFKWYIGLGGYGTIRIGDPLALSVGLRVPVGINAFFFENFLEPYIQVAPSIGINILPSFNFPSFFVPINLGVRFWIN